MNTKAVIFLILALNANCFAQSEQTQLDKINLAVVQEEQRLESVSSTFQRIQNDLKQLDTALNLMRGEERKIQDSFAEVGVEKKGVEQQILATEKQIAAVRALGLKRLKTLYMKRSTGNLETLFVSTAQASLSRNAFYLAKIQKFDRDLLEKYSTLITRSRQEKSKLELLEQQYQELKVSLQKKRQSIEQERGKQKGLLKQSEQERSKIEVSLTELRASALRLETVMSSLTGGIDEIELKKTPVKKRSVEILGDFDGPGLLEPGLRLLAPVQGEIIPQVSSKQGLDKFLNKKGVELETAAESEVRAIAPARVIYLGKMPGFGNIVILDHGKRWYSVYGRLGEILTEKGELLEAGEQIALTASATEKERNFYFEIRHNGSAVNPTRLGRFMGQ